MYVAMNPVKCTANKSSGEEQAGAKAQTNLQCGDKLREGYQQEVQVEEKLELFIEHDR